MFSACMHEHTTGPLFALLAVDHCDMLNSCPEDEPMTASDECLDATTDESLLETNPIQSPLQVFAGMGGLALIAERLPMLYPDVIQQVRLADTCICMDCKSRGLQLSNCLTYSVFYKNITQQIN